jgi:hypothetical protein
VRVSPPAHARRPHNRETCICLSYDVRKHGDEEVITLDYQAIEVTWTDGGKTAMDDWTTPI